MSANPMIEQVNRLVGNALADGEEVFLPGVGSLYVERRPARRVSRRRIEPPYRAVAFASLPRGRSLVERIAAAAQCEADEAQAMYDRWLEQAREGEAVTIEGVGTVKFKNFAPDASFDRLLNPQGRDAVRIRSGRRFDWTIWVGIAAIAIALGFGGYQFLLSYPDESRSVAEEERVAADAVERTVPGDAPAASGGDNHAGVAGESSAQGLAGGGPAAGARGGDLSEKTASGTTASGTTAASGTFSASEIAATGGAAASEAAAATSKPKPGAAQPTVPADPASLVSGRRYVVLGVFSTGENAARAVDRARRKEPAPTYRVYRFGEKYMVSPFESDDAQAAARFVRENENRFEGIWIYTAR